MIFVTVGTNEAPFDRLILALDRLPRGEQLIVQTGASQVRPEGALCIEELPFEALAEHVRRARVVVMHAGVGSVLTALANGKRPVIVPRRAEFGEAVDDHQLAFARRFEAAGLVSLVEDEQALPAIVSLPQLASLNEFGPGHRLTTELGDYMRTTIGGTPDVA
jgi:UDP-N-acetylglucosamine--N-acetylmuramyl-(pentapeptide) pyrophosphoryl-undecaprenol N-acetylglucosamine transferase